MDVSGALHEGLWLEYTDEVYFQAIDYEKIPFHCRKFHEHGHLITECPMNKIMEKPKENIGGKNKEAFIRPHARQQAKKRQQNKVSTSIKSIGNAFELLESEMEPQETN